MPLMRQGPGLVRGVARTAAVAGTATAVSGRVARRQQQRYAQQDAPAYEQQPAAAPAQAAPAAPQDPVAQLERLTALKEQGAISADEFESMKAKVLAA